MRFDKPRYFRQSMSWVHTWAGLVLGWLLFAVFVTGTLSFFRNEITLWMQPELHRARASDTVAERAFETLARVAPGAQQWTVSLPGPRSALVGLSWREEQPAQSAREGGGPQGGERAPAAREARRAPPEGAPRGEGDASGRGASERGSGERGGAERPMGGRGMGERGDGARATPERTAGEHGASTSPAIHGGGRETSVPGAEGSTSPWRGSPSLQAGAALREGGRRGAGDLGLEADAEEPVVAERGGAGAAQGGGGGGGRQQQGVHRATMDPASGELLQARQTAGGNFLYRFHFELYGMERTWGRWIVGIATMFMFVALITGVIVHRTIFRDFFTFRPAKGKRSWLDAHNASGVLALPFHIVITFSGLLLLGPQLMPFAADSAYQGEAGNFGREMRGNRGGDAPGQASGQPAGLTSIGVLLAEGERRWPEEGVGSIVVSYPGDAAATIELRQARGSGLTNRGATERLVFDGVSGALREASAPAEPSAVRAIANVLSAVHLGRFASPLPRWLLFLSGALGSLMVASGLVLWIVSREKERAALGRPPAGHRLVEAFNVAAVAGLLLAIAAYFWANRLLPAELAGRNVWEIRMFFGVWALTLVYASLRAHKAAWTEQLAAAGGLFALLPVLNGLTGGAHLGISMSAGQWQVAGFDLCALLIGVLLLHAAHAVKRHVPLRKPEQAAGKAVPNREVL